MRKTTGSTNVVMLGWAVLAMINGCAVSSSGEPTTSKATQTRSSRVSSAKIRSISPTSIPVRSTDLTLNVFGSAFRTSSVVQSNGSAQPTRFISSNQLSATLPQTDFARAGTIQISVADANRTSNAVPLRVVAASNVRITTTDLPGGQKALSYAATLQAEGGARPYSWSVSSGTLPPGLSLSASSGAIEGTPNGVGHYSFTARVADSSDTQPATKDLSIDISSPSPPPSDTAGFYGSGLNADGLGNQTIGDRWGYQLSYRFRAQHGGVLEKIHLYLICEKAGYSEGNGGQLLIQLQTDDGTESHLPSGVTLASQLLTQPSSQGSFPFVTLSPAATLEAGTLYHLVFSNPDPQSETNFVSVDAMWMETPLTPNNPTDTDLAMLYRATKDSNDKWTIAQGYTPILQLDYTDGTSVGWGYMEIWSDNPKTISGNQAVRQAFRVSGPNRPVTRVAIRVARTGGSGDLTVRLEQGDGAVIEQGAISAASLPLATSPGYSSHVWVTYTFQAVRTLFSGQDYHLVLTAPSESSYQAFPIRKGASYGFKDTTFFSDGYAQFTTGSGWTGWDQWGVPDRKEGDLQFFFTVVR